MQGGYTVTHNYICILPIVDIYIYMHIYILILYVYILGDHTESDPGAGDAAGVQGLRAGRRAREPDARRPPVSPKTRIYIDIHT